jgi:hypothetical protein
MGANVSSTGDFPLLVNSSPTKAIEYYLNRALRVSGYVRGLTYIQTARKYVSIMSAYEAETSYYYTHTHTHTQK